MVNSTVAGNGGGLTRPHKAGRRVSNIGIIRDAGGKMRAENDNRAPA